MFAQSWSSRTDLGLTNGAGCLDVNDSAELHVNEIVVGATKKCRSVVRSGPLRRRIGRRDELRPNLAGVRRRIGGDCDRKIVLSQIESLNRMKVIISPLLIRKRRR
jgi:hypothetical protein